jgi:hypothetical protein
VAALRPSKERLIGTRAGRAMARMWQRRQQSGCDAVAVQWHCGRAAKPGAGVAPRITR